MTITEKHVLFFGDWTSNFAWAPIKTVCMDGQIHEFFSTEQCFMWHKAYFFKDFDILRQIEELNFKEANSAAAKKLGRKVKNFNGEEWKKVAYDIMLKANLSKYSQNKILFDKITDPKFDGKHFVEASPYDAIWGIKMGEFDKNADDKTKWKGTNWLGKVLDEVRAKLLDGYKEEIEY